MSKKYTYGYWTDSGGGIWVVGPRNEDGTISKYTEVFDSADQARKRADELNGEHARTSN